MRVILPPYRRSTAPILSLFRLFQTITLLRRRALLALSTKLAFQFGIWPQVKPTIFEIRLPSGFSVRLRALVRNYTSVGLLVSSQACSALRPLWLEICSEDFFPFLMIARAKWWQCQLWHQETRGTQKR